MATLAVEPLTLEEIEKRRCAARTKHEKFNKRHRLIFGARVAFVTMLIFFAFAEYMGADFAALGVAAAALPFE